MLSPIPSSIPSEQATELALKILILGVGGMLGHCLFKYLSAESSHSISGTVRQLGPIRMYFPTGAGHIFENIDATDIEALRSLLRDLKPDLIVNCIGIIKQLKQAEDPIPCIAINALFPHQLARLAGDFGTRIIHISTDCVFDGKRGLYCESDISNAYDLYGRTKFLGELNGLAHAITIRTSIIGHELTKSLSLIDWFLSQHGQAKGYRKAIYSGLPTVELAELILKHIIPRADLHGLYHVTSEPINKYDLLRLVAEEYGKDIAIISSDDVAIDRSMISLRFRAATGYQPPSWEVLVKKMHGEYLLHHKSVRQPLAGR